MARQLAVLVVAAVVAAAGAACSPGGPPDPGPCPVLEESFTVSAADQNGNVQGPFKVTVFSPSVADTGTSLAGVCHDGPLPVVLFAHGASACRLGFCAENPAAYRDLINHLVSRGNIVVYPSMPGSDSTLWYNIAAAGFLSAPERSSVGTRMDTDRVGVIGHSLGGGIVPWALQRVAAAGWGASSLYGVAISPWYSLHLGAGPIALPPHTRWLTLSYEQDSLVDARIAIEVFESVQLPATRKTYLTVLSDVPGSGAVADHFVPTSGTPQSRENVLDVVGLRSPIDLLADCSVLGRDGCFDSNDLSFGTDAVPPVVEANPIDVNPRVSAVGAECEDARNPRPCPTRPSLAGGDLNASALQVSPGRVFRDQELTSGSVSPPQFFQVSDDTTSAGALAVTIQSANPATVPPESVVVTDVEESYFGCQLDPRPPCPRDKKLTITPPPGASGTSVITVTVTDGGGLSAARSFSVTVR